MYVIRQIHTIDVIHRLDRSIFPNDQASELLNAYWFVARHEGKAVAFAGITPSGFLLRCGVIPAQRGQGLQRRLIRKRVQWARQNLDINEVITYTICENVYSSNNLIAEGFTLYIPEDGPEEDINHWRLKL